MFFANKCGEEYILFPKGAHLLLDLVIPDRHTIEVLSL